jgi:hypothetical protein
MSLPHCKNRVCKRTLPDAQPPLRLSHADPSEEEEVEQENPVCTLGLMQLTRSDFLNLRTTVDGRISVYDAIEQVADCSDADARQKYRRWARANRDESSRIRKVAFPRKKGGGTALEKIISKKKKLTFLRFFFFSEEKKKFSEKIFLKKKYSHSEKNICRDGDKFRLKVLFLCFDLFYWTNKIHMSVFSYINPQIINSKCFCQKYF